MTTKAPGAFGVSSQSEPSDPLGVAPTFVEGRAQPHDLTWGAPREWNEARFGHGKWNEARRGSKRMG